MILAKSSTVHKMTRLSLACALLLPTLANATRFEAEDYSFYEDSTPGNNGGAYRNDDVDIEVVNDAGGGHNVGWIDAGEWLSFEQFVIPNSGVYEISARVASPGGAQLAVDLDGGTISLGDLTVPATGGWQNWVTVSRTATIDAGTYNLGVFARSSGFNLNWVEVNAVSTPTPTPTATPTPTQPPFVDQRFEAEDYNNAFDTSAGNSGGQYRNDNVDIEASTDEGSGFNVGWWATGEWLSFNTLTIPSEGNYKIRARVASPNGGSASFDLGEGTSTLGSITIPATGAWQNWQTVTLDAQLSAGTHSLRVLATSDGWNLNWLEVVADGEVEPPEPTVTWADEFDFFDTSAWTYDEGGHGWGNNELQYYSNGTNVSIEFDPQAGSNVLVLEARQEQGGTCWWGGNCDYTSGKINSRDKKSFQYGRLEARLKLPRTQGIWPAFWMLGNNFETQGWPQGGELDIMEHVNTNNITSGALHGPGYSGNTPVTGHLVHAQDISAGYHVYAVEWDANGIRWFVDDTNFYSVTKTEVERFGEWVYDQPFWFLFNLAVGGNWPGEPDHANFSTQRMYIDYVRVYQ